MSKRTDWLVETSKRLGVLIDIPYWVTLRDGTRLEAIARIQEIGGIKGMLIFGPSANIREQLKQLIAEGYGCATLDEPAANENFDIETAKEMLRDWSWCGDPTKKPGWME
jgi:hypothetical protein